MYLRFKESTIRRKGKKVLSYASRATRCDNPRPDQASAAFAGGRKRCTTGKEHSSQYTRQEKPNFRHRFPLFSLGLKLNNASGEFREIESMENSIQS